MAGAKKAVLSKKAGQGKRPKLKIRKGDKVVVIAGKDIGREGTVIKTNPDKQMVLVQGVNMIAKNKKVNYQGGQGTSRSYKEGGIVHQEALIHVSNVQLIDPDSKSPARAGYRFDADKGKVRVSRASGKDI